MPRAQFFTQPTGSQYFPTVGHEERLLPKQLEGIATHLATKKQQLEEMRGLEEMGISVPGYKAPQTTLEKMGFYLRKPTQPSELTQAIVKTKIETQGAIDAARTKALIESGAKKTEREKGLRGEFTKQSTKWKEIRDSYGRVQASAVDPSPAGDLALIFNYMKILDPGSVVRESEFATAANAAGVPERIRNFYNQIISGERLGFEDSKQRDDFVDRANRLFEVKKRQHQQLVDEYTRISKAIGIDPENVIVEFGLAEAGIITTEKPVRDITELSGAELEKEKVRLGF